MERPPRPGDHYTALGVSPLASQKAVECAFHSWRERHRRGGVDDDAFLRAERAYHVLADPARRARHDRQTGRVRHPAWRGNEDSVARSCIRRGLHLMARGRPEAALPLLERAARLKPEDAACRSYLGLLLARGGGRLHEAARHAAFAVALQPREPAFLCNLASVYGAAGLRGRALRLRLRAWRILLADAVRQAAYPGQSRSVSSD